MEDGWLQFRDDDRTMGEEAYQKLQQSYTVEERDVLLAIVGGTTGKVARVPPLENFTVQRSTAIIRPDTQVLKTDYLYYWLRSEPVQTTIQSTYEKYAAQPGIYLKDVANLPLLVPPLEEQTTISSYLDDQRTSHKKLENNIQKSIDLLEEKRQALITDATTGKINIPDIRQVNKQEMRK
jgi:type I restriction enzyme S subunit